MSPVSTFQYRPHSPLRQGTNGNSLTSSPDPLLLSLSPRIHHADADTHNSPPTNYAAVLQMTPSTSRLDQDPGADIGASPSLSMHPSRGVSSRGLSPSPDPFTVSTPPNRDVNHNGTSAIENATGAAEGRYSMRTRRPRQLNPYAFDRLEYKHQLKHHPDAIVKLTGNGRRSPVESSSRSSKGDTDRTAENSGGEPPLEYARMLPRTKGKKRHRASTGHPSAPPPVAHRGMSGVQLSSGSSSLDRRFTVSSKIADLALAASIPDVVGGGSPAEAATWYPDAFDDLSSEVGSDDMHLSTAQDDLRDGQVPPSRVKRRRVLFLLYDGCL